MLDPSPQPVSVPTGCERALYLGDESAGAASLTGYDRLYIGWEFCPLLLPRKTRLDQLLTWAVAVGLPLTLVTPPVREPELEPLHSIIGIFSERSPESEVVYNDWGVLRLIRTSYPALKPVMGRVLFKMKRDPAAPEMAQTGNGRGSMSPLDNSAFLRFLASTGTTRIEADFVTDHFGLPSDCNGDLRISLHHPFRFITQTFSCPAASYGAGSMTLPTESCHQECRSFSVRIEQGDWDGEQIQVGNTMFYENKAFPRLSTGARVDRLVERRRPTL